MFPVAAQGEMKHPGELWDITERRSGLRKHLFSLILLNIQSLPVSRCRPGEPLPAPHLRQRQRLPVSLPLHRDVLVLSWHVAGV